jgi:arabinose-5-phosphate isomerase
MQALMPRRAYVLLSDNVYSQMLIHRFMDIYSQMMNHNTLTYETGSKKVSERSIEIMHEARRVLSEEIVALELARQHLTSAFADAVEQMRSARLVLVFGVGKSGLIGRKIAATFTSTGTPAVFVHPAEALHGDIGLASEGDVCLLLSKSGTTAELLSLMPTLAARKLTTIGLLGTPVDSPLARLCGVVIDASVQREACPIGTAPMSSTVVALALGDALAAALMRVRGFTAEQFAMNHAAGQLGKNLTLRVRDVMHTGAAMPRVNTGAGFREILAELTEKGLGCVCVIEPATERLAGIITDGDVRRALQRFTSLENLHTTDIMTPQPLTIHTEALLGAALEMMEDRPRQIGVLAVVDEAERLRGVIRVHDIVRTGM